MAVFEDPHGSLCGPLPEPSVHYSILSAEPAVSPGRQRPSPLSAALRGAAAGPLTPPRTEDSQSRPRRAWQSTSDHRARRLGPIVHRPRRAG